MNTPTNHRLRRLATGLIRARFAILAAAAVATLLAWTPSGDLQFDQSIESLYAEKNPHLEDFTESKRLFGGDEFVFVAWEDTELFDADGYLSEESAEQIREFSAQLNEVPGVRAESTQNLADAFDPPALRELLAEVNVLLRRLFAVVIQKRQPKMKPLLEGLLVGKDDRTTAIILRLEAEQDAPISRGETIRKIRELADGHAPPAVVAGEPVQVHDMFRLVEEDGRDLFWWSLVVLVGVMFACFCVSFVMLDLRNRSNEQPAESTPSASQIGLRAAGRSLWWAVLPVFVVVTTVAWTRALLVIADFKLSMVSAILNAIVTIVGVATVIHACVRFLKYRYRGQDRRDSWHRAFSELARPIFWACATTAVGFGALLSSRITPVRSFGMMMALAVALVLVSCAALLPGGMLIGRLDGRGRQAETEHRRIRFLAWIAELVERFPGAIVCGFTVVFVAELVGLMRLEVETDLSRNFRKKSPIVQGLKFVESRLGGAGTWEVNFDAKDGLTPEYLEQVRKLVAKLRKRFVDVENPELTKVVALTDGLDSIPATALLGTPREILARLQPEYEPSLYNPAAGRMRIMLRAREQQPADVKLNLIAEVEEAAKETFPEAKATGLFVLLAHLIESLLDDQLVSFAWAALGIGLMMTFAFRSWRIGLVSLLPNMFPIVLVIGTMGWIGLPVNIATAMIASVSMGLTVDSSIHYITGYRDARRQGADVSAAIAQSHEGVGVALVFANVALIVGFSVLTLSEFIPLVYFGILVSVAILGGLVGNLMLLPVLLSWADRTLD